MPGLDCLPNTAAARLLSVQGTHVERPCRETKHDDCNEEPTCRNINLEGGQMTREAIHKRKTEEDDQVVVVEEEGSERGDVK